MATDYHIPVLLTECVDALVQDADWSYVDATFGGGGHSKEIVKRLDKGKLFVVDRDLEALNNIDSDKIIGIQHNYKYLKHFLYYHNQKQVGGILADLGISSHQIDDDKRGFAHRFDTGLDMRMDQKSGLSAADIINIYSEKRLANILWNYGELRNSRALATRIVSARQSMEIKTSFELNSVLEDILPGHKRSSVLSQIYQALRIEVNSELESLEALLESSIDLIQKGGKLVVLTYHSLEDRLVKNFIRSGNTRGELNKDSFGKVLKPFTAENKKPIIAGEKELKENPRSRSAKLRVAIRN